MAKGERVIAVSQAIKEHIAESYPKTNLDLITVNPRGVDDAQYAMNYRPAPGAEALRLRQAQQDQYVITLPGRVTGWKGGEDFLSIIHGLRQQGIPAVGWFAGGVHGERDKFAQKLKEQIQTLGLDEAIEFLGQRSDLQDIMAVSDVVVSLSTKPEAFGRVSLEALRIGKPLLGYAHGGVKEQLEALFPEGAVQPSDRNAATTLLTQWYHERPTVPERENPFTLQNMLATTLGVYEELLSSPR